MRRLVFASIRLVSAVDRWARERLTPAGWVALAAGGTAAVAGVDTHQTVTYRAFAFLACLLLVAWLASLAFRARVRVSRELPQYVTAGEPFSYRVDVVNTGARPVAGATLVERLADPRPGYREWLATREPGEERRNWFDRKAGYFRWRWYIERQLPEAPAEVPLPPLPPGRSESLKLTLLPRRRGRLSLAGFTLGRVDPLGLVKGLARVTAPAKVIALPKRYRLPPLALPGKRKFQQGGVTLAASVGEAEEFLALRDYRPGDPLQRVHWKSFARVGVPVVKEYQDEFFERHALVLDTARTQGEDAVFEDAVALAASFVYTIDTLECLLDLLFVGGEVRSYTAGRGQLHASHMLEILAGIAPSRADEFDALARAVLAQRGALSSVILVLVQWDDARRKLLEALSGSGMEVRALLVCDHKPAELPPRVLALHPGRIEAGLARLS
ncbi:MAG: DUF58 domain-containing protein [Burkholderiales bacterium]